MYSVSKNTTDLLFQKEIEELQLLMPTDYSMECQDFMYVHILQYITYKLYILLCIPLFVD